ncbi:MAG: 3-deoxy-D-manno-octulosonic acid transferase [Planctomycetota bacterium]
MTRPAPILRDPNPGLSRFLLHALYDAAWIVVVVLASPWWLWRCARDARFRAMARARLGAGLPRAPTPGARPRALIHGVSVGEVKAAQSLVRALERAHPELDIVISTTTDTGFDVARKIYPALTVVRFPIDPSFVVRRFLDRVAPACVVLMELEIWPNFLRCANRRAIPIAVVNGRITPQSFGHYRLFKDLLPQFNRISLFCVQDEEYAERFERLSADRARIQVCGNIKADGLELGRVEPGVELVRLLGGRAGQRVIVAGSTHHPEERSIAAAWRAGAARARLILVPRHPERAKDVAADLAADGSPPQLLTRLRAGEAPDSDRPCIVDTIGELEQVYALGDVVFVGGTLVPHGGQNVLEPAAQAKPVLVGPHVHNFVQEVALLERAGACRTVRSEDELAAQFAALTADPDACERMGAAGRAAVEAQTGATERTLRALEEGCFARIAG